MMKTLTSEEIEKRIADSYELPNNVLAAVSEPLVTVRTSTYQHGPFIRECIESVLAQKTNFPFEFIIGEDFSTDGTREIVFEYAKKYPDIIRVITADYNVGSKANGRRCLRAFRGKYIATCEGDDYWTDPNKLQQQVDILEAHPEYSLCFHNAEVIYDDRNIRPHLFAFYEKEVYTIKDVISRPWFIPTQSMLIRRNLIQHPEWTKYIYNGDLSLQLMFAAQGPFYCINKSMSVYRRHKNSMSANKAWHFAPMRIVQLLYYFDMHSEFKYHALILKRTEEITRDFYQVFLYERPLPVRLLSFDYYWLKFQGMQRKMKSAYGEYGLRDPSGFLNRVFRRRR